MISILKEIALPAALPATPTFAARLPSVWNVLRPRGTVDSLAWCNENLRMPNGAHFNLDEYPHVAGVFKAWDHPQTRRIVLQWGTRLGKTAFGQAVSICAAANNPVPMMYVSSTETLAAQNMRDKVYPMIEQSPALRDQLPPPHRRSVYRVDLTGCRLYCAWSGSVSMLADKAIYLLHLSEVDKFDESESKEGDPVDLAIERTKEFPMAKILFEGTPTVSRRSRIERELLASTNRQRYVPCPHCGDYQILFFGSGDAKEGGIIFDKDKAGNLDPLRARDTARYVCRRCHKEIHDEHRARMLRRGEWIADGERVNKRGQISGTPKRSRHQEGFQLSSLYSLQLTWGDIAAAFASSFRVERQRHNFENGWLARTYSLARVVQTWEQLGTRLCDEQFHIGDTPADSAFLTVGIDRQIDHWVYTVIAYGKWRTQWLVDYGIETEWDELLKNVIRRSYGHLGVPRLTLVDTGFESADTKAKCYEGTRPNNWIYPCKGFGTLAGAKPYDRKPDLDERTDARTKRRIAQRRGLAGRWFVNVTTGYYQAIVDRIYQQDRGTEGSLTIPFEAKSDQDLLEQLLNETLAGNLDRFNYEKRAWVRIDETIPNDFRDCHRYSMCAADIVTRGAWNRIVPAKKAGMQKPNKTKGNEPDQSPPPADQSRIVKSKKPIRQGKGIRGTIRRK